MSISKPPSDRKPNPALPPEDHAIAAAAAIAGGAAGAVAGAIGGPIGMVAGGAIGAAIGAISGATMENDEHRHDAHERELDDDIGVTKGTIGAPESVKRPSLEVIDEARRDEEAKEMLRSRR